LVVIVISHLVAEAVRVYGEIHVMVAAFSREQAIKFSLQGWKGRTLRNGLIPAREHNLIPK
jgi:hypothetical protein